MSDVQIPTIKPTVQLTGEDGSAIAIMSRCKRAGRKAGWTREQQKAFQKECLGGDYDHVLNTAMAWCNVDGADDKRDNDDDDDESWLDI